MYAEKFEERFTVREKMVRSAYNLVIKNYSAPITFYKILTKINLDKYLIQDILIYLFLAGKIQNLDSFCKNDECPAEFTEILTGLSVRNISKNDKDLLEYISNSFKETLSIYMK